MLRTCIRIIGNLRCHERATQFTMKTFKRNAALFSSLTARKASTNSCRCRTTNAARKESQDGQDSEEGSESESESDHESKRRRKKKKKKNKRRSSHSDDSEGDSDDSGDRKRWAWATIIFCQAQFLILNLWLSHESHGSSYSWGSRRSLSPNARSGVRHLLFYDLRPSKAIFTLVKLSI